MQQITPYDDWKSQIYTFLKISKDFINKDIRRMISGFVKFDFRGKLVSTEKSQPCNICLLPCNIYSKPTFDINFKVTIICKHHGIVGKYRVFNDFNPPCCYAKTENWGVCKVCMNKKIRKFIF